jgi:serine/threonine-protein kinase
MNHTRTGVVMGTPLYLSPEQAKGAKVDAATDVYSLGAMAYEMGAGVVPFLAESAVEIMAMHISVRAEPLAQRAPWGPPMFEQLVFRMLEKDPRNRPPIADVVQQLQYMRAQPEIVGAAAPGTTPNAQWTPIHTPRPQTAPHGVPVTPQSAVQQSGVAPPKKRTGLVIALVALVVLAAGGAAAFVIIGNKADKSPAVAQAKTEPATSAQEPAKTEPATTQSGVVPAASGSGSAAAPTTTEPGTPEPAKTEPVKTPDKTADKPADKPTDKPTDKIDTTKPTRTTKAEPPKARLGTVAVTIAGAARGSSTASSSRARSRTSRSSSRPAITGSASSRWATSPRCRSFTSMRTRRRTSRSR